VAEFLIIVSCPPKFLLEILGGQIIGYLNFDFNVTKGSPWEFFKGSPWYLF